MGGAFPLSKTVFRSQGNSFNSAHATVVVAGRGVRLRLGPGRLRTRTIRAGSAAAQLARALPCICAQHELAFKNLAGTLLAIVNSNSDCRRPGRGFAVGR